MKFFNIKDTLSIIFTIFCCLGFFIASSDASRKPKSDLNEDWTLFKKSIRKSYKNLKDDLERRLNWEENFDLINKHNLDADLKRGGFKLKLNEFSDLSNEIFLKQKNGLKANFDKKKSKIRTKSRVNKRQISRSKPTEYDGRLNCLIPVRNQGDCGACFSFAAISTLECHYARRKSIVSLSEQQAIDCTEDFGSYGCDGGSMDQVYDYFLYTRNFSNVRSVYPYEARKGNCRFKEGFVGAVIRDYNYIETESELEEAVYRYGAVSCGIDASLPSFQLYSSGIYDDPFCSKTEINHAITVVGYTAKYFICKNSWGTSWGIDGYFYLPKGINACGLINYCVYPIV